MFKLMKNVFADILLLYKSFLHFNLSKIIIFAVSILHAIILALPFILVLWGVYYYVIQTWNAHIIDNYLFSFFVILGFFIVFVSFLYYFVLQTKLNLSYIKGTKLGYSKNFYFNFKLFINYFKTMTLSLLIVLLPFIIYKIIFLFSVDFVWWIESARALIESKIFNSFSIGIKILEIVTLISFIYLTYKTLFSIVILVDESKWEKFNGAFHYIKKSFKLTKGYLKSFKFIVITLLVFIMSLPINIPLNYFSFGNNHLSNYIEYKVNPSSGEKFNFYYIQELELEFWKEDMNSLKNELKTNKKYELILEVLNFLFIFGLFEMMVLSFYKRELKWNKKNKKEKDTKKENVKKVTKKDKKSKLAVKKNVTKKVEEKKVVSKKTETKKVPAKKVIAKKTSVKKTEKVEIKKTPVKRGRPRKTEK